MANMQNQILLGLVESAELSYYRLGNIMSVIK